MIPQHYEMILRRRERFWWYVGRRECFASLLNGHLSKTARLGMDAGCGPGTNEALYEGLAERWLCGDVNPESFRIWRPQAGRLGLLGDLAMPPVKEGYLDLILLLDVLEHVDNERPILDAAWRLLKPGGILFVSVPALQALWSWHDVQAGHRRRYRLSSVRRLLESSGFEVPHARYFNCLLTLPMFVIRKVTRRMRSMEDRIELDLSPGALNGLFLSWLRVERRLSDAGFRLPWGSTAVLLARKP
jgi:SAM-dependent methyltransferase